MEKVLTVSIAAYNVEKTLREAVDSLLADASSREKLELIIVNDGSRDRTGEIAREYAERYPDTVKVIDKENGGYGSTINASLGRAGGKYYRLLDGDDRYDPEALRNLLLFRENCEADLVMMPLREVRGRESKIVENHPEIPEETVTVSEFRLKTVGLASMHGMTVRTEKLRGLGESITEHCYYTDTEFDLDCLVCAETICRFDQPVYLYALGIEGQSVSIEGMRAHAVDMLLVARSVVDRYERYEKKLTGGGREMAEATVRHAVSMAFKLLTLLEDGKMARGKLLDFESFLGEKKLEVCRKGSRSTMVRIMSLCRYRPLWFWRRAVERRLREG